MTVYFVVQKDRRPKTILLANTRVYRTHGNRQKISLGKNIIVPIPFHKAKENLLSRLKVSFPSPRRRKGSGLIITGEGERGGGLVKMYKGARNVHKVRRYIVRRVQSG